MAREGAPCDSLLGLTADSFGNAPVESFDEAVGLRPIRSGQAVIDRVVGTDEIEGMAARGTIGRLVFHIDGEAVGELGTVVGENGMNGMREVGEEPLQEARRGVGIAPGMDLQINVAGSAVDGDESVAFVPLQCRQMLEVDMNEPDGCLLKDPNGRLVRLGSLAQAVALEATMDSTA
jgi:hypothetical protein